MYLVEWILWFYDFNKYFFFLLYDLILFREIKENKYSIFFFYYFVVLENINFRKYVKREFENCVIVGCFFLDWVEFNKEVLWIIIDS